MDTRKIKKMTNKTILIAYIENHIILRLQNKSLSKLDKDEFICFIYEFFLILDWHRKRGVSKEDLHSFLVNFIKEESLNYYDDDVFEHYFVPITEELINFCPAPFFWDTPLEEYMKKWEKIYFPLLKKNE